VPHTYRMIAILGGLGAAVMWATATLTSSRSGRLIGATSSLAWMMLVGVLVAGPLALASGPVPTMTPTLAFWVTGSAAGGVVGLLLTYRALRIGKVGVVTALTSTEGAMAAVLAVIAGERLTIPVMVMLCVIVVGIAAVALAAGEATEPVAVSDERRAVILGSIAALAFGLSIYSLAKVGQSMPPLMAVLPVRVLGFVGVFIPMAVTGRLRLTRRAAPMVLLIGVCEVLGNASYVVGSGQSIAVAAVLASQFAALATVAAFVLFRERLSLGQRSGVVAICVGVALLTAVRSA
jgi:drug/metabolite transporter (DMT)-like permease